MALAFTACNELIGERGNDVRITKSYTVDDFNQVEISGAFKVTLIPSKNNEIILHVDENLVKYIEIKVRGNKLFVETDRRLISRDGIEIDIPVNRLTNIFSSGASDIKSEEALSSKDLAIDVSGAGKVDLKLDVQSVNLDLSGATMVYLEGAAKHLEVDMSGAGSLEADGFEVENCRVDISGVGHALVNVTGTLNAQVSGLGKVEYVGDPESVKGDVSGIGNINKADN